MSNVKSLLWDRKSQLELWFRDLHFSSLDLIRYASCFGVGFISGLLFKRWSKYIIFIMVSVTIVLALLQGLSIITINFATIQKMTGLQNITTMGGIGLSLMQKSKQYAGELGCWGFGFIIGFKTG